MRFLFFFIIGLVLAFGLACLGLIHGYLSMFMRFFLFNSFFLILVCYYDV
jgi:hypothetical protein